MIRADAIKRFEELERMKEAVLASLEGLPDEAMQAPAAPGKWSIAQILDHVASAESRSVQYVRKKTQTPESVPPAGIMCGIRTAALMLALSSPFKFKAPDVVAGAPDNPTASELVERWETVRDDLRSLIEGLPEEVLDRALFRHPVAGRMNMMQMLAFMRAHLKRHAAQAAAVVR